MLIALKAAFAKLGMTSPNPAVGAVIVKNDAIVSIGVTQACGYDHAERVAIRNAACDLAGASMYVTLEPCCHWGKTPPCTSAIIQSGISRIFIPMLDPNPAVAGKGVRTLQDAGVEVIFLRDSTQAAVDLLRPFTKNIIKRKPFIIHKAAATLDGRTAAQSGDSKWISTPAARLLVHRLRACADTVIVGRATVDADDPQLTVRLGEFSDIENNYFNDSKYAVSGYANSFITGLLESWKQEMTHSSKKIVLGLPHSLINKKIMNDDVYFFVEDKDKHGLSKRHDYDILSRLIEDGRVRFMQSASKHEQIHEMLDILHGLGSMIVVLEGGAEAAGSFFDANEIDQCLYFYCPLLLGQGKSILQGRGRQSINESLTMHDITSVYLGHDVLISGYKEPYCEAI